MKAIILWEIFLYTQVDTWIFLWAFILNRFFTLRCACLWFEPALTFSLALLLARTMDSVMDVFADLLTATHPVLWPGFRFCFCSFLEPQKNRLASASASALTNIWRRKNIKTYCFENHWNIHTLANSLSLSSHLMLHSSPKLIYIKA